MPPRKGTNLDAWQLCYITGSDEPGHLARLNQYVRPENAFPEQRGSKVTKEGE